MIRFFFFCLLLLTRKLRGRQKEKEEKKNEDGIQHQDYRVRCLAPPFFNGVGKTFSPHTHKKNPENQIVKSVRRGAAFNRFEKEK